MPNAKNNHCVMRKQSWTASRASTGYTQEGGGRNSPGSVRHLGEEENEEEEVEEEESA